MPPAPHTAGIPLYTGALGIDRVWIPTPPPRPGGHYRDMWQYTCGAMGSGDVVTPRSPTSDGR